MGNWKFRDLVVRYQPFRAKWLDKEWVERYCSWTPIFSLEGIIEGRNSSSWSRFSKPPKIKQHLKCKFIFSSFAKVEKVYPGKSVDVHTRPDTRLRPKVKMGRENTNHSNPLILPRNIKFNFQQNTWFWRCMKALNLFHRPKNREDSGLQNNQSWFTVNTRSPFSGVLVSGRCVTRISERVRQCPYLLSFNLRARSLELRLFPCSQQSSFSSFIISSVIS